MPSHRLDLNAPVLPDHGLAGLVVRAKLLEMNDLLVGLGVSKPGSFKLVSPFEAAYRLGGGEVEITADVRNGKVFKLTAYPGYRGSLLGEIHVGMVVNEALSLQPSFYYDEAEEAIVSEIYQGITIDVPEVDPSPELVPSMVISSISVYASEIRTLEGQQGRW